MEKDILETVHMTAQGLHKAGAISTITMRKYDRLCLPEIQEFNADEIKGLRLDARVSQPVFAKFLNVSPSIVKQWEIGEKHPGGAALKLLNLVSNKGLTAIV